MSNTRILVTGANGQFGSVLATKLVEIHGKENVFLSDITEPSKKNPQFLFLDILNKTRIKEIIEDYKITEIYHLAAILSASGEYNPLKTWNINFNGLMSILELAKEYKIKRVFFPSTIGVFGDTTPKTNTPQDSPLLPETVYGISKIAGELWSNYYYKKYEIDVRSVRYPGIIGYQSIPAGGTTDYAVEIYHAAVKGEEYECFLSKETRLPMIYMPDAINAAINLMQSDIEKLTIHYSYNLASMSFTPAEITESIRKIIPEFKIKYKPDFRQKIAESWTESIDDTIARNDWDWNPDFDLDMMTADMITNLKKQYNK